MKLRKILAAISLFSAPILSVAAGLGSQSWGESLVDDQNGGANGPMPFLIVACVWIVCWWFALSSSSPIKGKPLWEGFFLIFAPPLAGALVIAVLDVF